jgi:myosin heavy subunit
MAKSGWECSDLSIQASESSSKQKYSAEIDRLKAELEKSKRSCERLTKERDENKDKVEKMERSIKNIDESYQEFTRQLAGRFPNNPKEVNKMRRENFYEDVQEDFSDSQTDSSKDTRKSWHLWINTILLGLVLVCVSLVLALTLTTSGILVKDKNKTREVVEKLEDPVETSTLESDQESYENASESENLIAAEDSADKIEYDDAESCRIDIKGLKASTLVPGTEYKLSIKRIKGGEQAVVPNGTWKVKIEPSTLLNNQDVFKVSQEFSGDSVQIQYIGEGGFFLSRIIKVK